ncbi:MAG: 6-phospho-beta-glucosidase [Clostridium sp.]
MKKDKIKIVTIGGGSSYTPELIEGFIKRKDELPIKEIWLVDIEDGKEKLEIVGNLAKRMIEKAGLDWELHLTLDRREALKDADFVSTQLRVGLLDARIKDERIPLSHGVLGQETNGAGGILKAFRTIPVILDIVKDMKELCPDAWLVNFTNPAGMVTEAVLNYGDFEKVVGLCNVPINHMYIESEMTGKKLEDLNFKFAGLNHFHWHRTFDNEGNELTQEILEKQIEKATSGVANIKSIPFIPEQLREVGLLPCFYHQYYYLHSDMVEKELEEFKNNETRAEVVKRTEAELFELYKDPNLNVKPEQLTKRGGTHYSDAACELIASIHNDKRTTMVVSTRNRGALTDLPYDSAVEVSSIITAAGPMPISFGKFEPAIRGHVQIMKAMEEETVKAAVTGSYGTAMQAFTLNPMIPAGKVAKTILDELLVAHKSYLPQFAEKISELENK